MNEEEAKEFREGLDSWFNYHRMLKRENEYIIRQQTNQLPIKGDNCMILFNKPVNRIEDPDIIICECGYIGHQIIFRYDKEDNWIYCDIHLSNYAGFFRRLWWGIRYIFGYKSNGCEGEFDNIIITEKEKDRFIHILNKIEYRNTPLLKSDEKEENKPNYIH